jgi:hypothetical protein
MYPFLFSFLTQQIFLPHLSLAFEYQGEQHYFPLSIFGTASIRKRRDQAKCDFAAELGITLIPIPFWWDRSPNSLAATIQLLRPDINILAQTTKDMTKPIPLELPLRFKKRLATATLQNERITH